MENPFVVKLDAQNRAWRIEEAPFDPEDVSDRLEIVADEQSFIRAKPLTVEEPRQRSSEQRRPGAESASAPPPSPRPAIAPAEHQSKSVKTPTVEEFRQKAQQCRAEAESYTVRESRALLLEIAHEYDRLAARGEQFEERARLPNPSPMNATALSQWYA